MSSQREPVPLGGRTRGEFVGVLRAFDVFRFRRSPMIALTWKAVGCGQ